MGIRIHKTLGWGMELTWSEYQELVNEDYDGISFDNYIDYVKAVNSESIYSSSELPLIQANAVDLSRISGSNVVSIVESFEETEDGEDKITLIITPVSEIRDWKRYDSAIDRYEMSGQPNNTIKYLKNGIFPWSDGYMDKRTGERMMRDKMEIIQSIRPLQHDPEEFDEFLTELAAKLGFDSFKEYQENIVPYVPDVVINPVNFMNLFKDKSTVNQLHPMLATYWQ